MPVGVRGWDKAVDMCGRLGFGLEDLLEIGLETDAGWTGNPTGVVLQNWK